MAFAVLLLGSTCVSSFQTAEKARIEWSLLSLLLLALYSSKQPDALTGHFQPGLYMADVETA